RGLYVPLWSARILEEWARATHKLGPAAEVVARGEIAEARAAFPGAEIAAQPRLEARLHLPDANDVHVLAAAIGGSTDIIVTFNTSDFPRRLLAEVGVERLDPDLFLLRLWHIHPTDVSAAVEAVRARAERLSGEAQPVRQLLKRARLPRLGKALVRERTAGTLRIRRLRRAGDSSPTKAYA